MKAICLPVNDRPDYLLRVLESIKTATPVDYSIFASVEPGNSECLEILKKVTFIPVKIHVNEKKKGINENTFNSMEMAFKAGADFMVYIEDDVIVSPDAFDLADWYFAKHINDGVLLCLYNNQNGDADVIVKVNGSFAWGLCVPRGNWANYLRPVWLKPNKEHATWDYNVNSMVKSKKLKVLIPQLSRCMNIGRENGTFYTPEIYDMHFSGISLNTEKRKFDYKLAS